MRTALLAPIKPGLSMRIALLFLTCLVFTSLAAAQDSPIDLRRGDVERHAFGVWGGVSFASPGWWGAVREREVFIIGLRYRRTVSQSENATVAYTMDVIPAAAVTNTPVRTRRFCCTSLPAALRRNPDGETERIEPSTAYGLGLAPFGLQLELFRQNPVYLTLGGGGGLLLFDRDVPRLDTRKMNFTVTLNAGLRARVFEDWELTFGYKFHHLSNAGTGTFNPGLDSNMLYLGWMRR